MDDIIIILLTIVFTIVAAINQSKNKKRAVQSGQERDPDFPEGFFGEKRMEPGPRPVSRDVAKTLPRVQPLKNPTLLKENTTSFGGPVEGMRNEIVTGTMVRKSDGIPEPDDPDLLERFSLKDAVIYSEILHPKYL
jgi:hypothetical protein